MRKILMVSALLIYFSSAFSQEPNRNLYSGGMLILQPGFIVTGNDHQRIENPSFGLGGILRLYIYRQLKVGIYGGTFRTSYTTSGANTSYLSIGYGGPTIGFSRKVNRFRYTVSAFIGMGAIRNLHIERQIDTRLTDAHLYEESSIVFSPVVSVDYALSQRIHLTVQAVCLTTRFRGAPVFNPTLQIGLLFNR